MQAGTKKRTDIPDADRDFYQERRYRTFGNLVPRDVASRAAIERCDAGFGVNNTGLAVFLDFKYAIDRLGEDVAVSYTHLDVYKRQEKAQSASTPKLVLPIIAMPVWSVSVP